MKKNQLLGIFLFLFVAALLFEARFRFSPSQTMDFASRGYDRDIASDRGNAVTVPGGNHTYALSGYLPENLSGKIKSYVVIKGRLIQDVLTVKPVGMDVVETQSIIFPGLIDMHSHIKYNILPLWSQAQGQFLNRYEWRKKFAPYKDAVSYNMKAFPGNTICAAVRWAEVKALTGGVTSLQGLGNDGRCAAGFGIHNIEIPGEYGNKQKIRSATDILDPGLLGSVYQPRLDPEILKISSQPLAVGEERPSKDQIYDEVLVKLLTSTHIIDWMETFYSQPRSLKTGLRLLLGDDLGYAGLDTIEGLEAVKPQVLAVLKHTKRFAMNDKLVGAQWEAMKLWLFGDQAKGKGYMQLPAATKPMSGLSLIEDAQTMEFFGKAGVMAVDRKVRRYLVMFETATRRSVIKYLQAPDALAIVAHLSEGMRNDSYNRSEYKYVEKLGMNRKGLVLIHAVGLNEADLQDVAKNEISIVWSPFSNLLLYGETLDVATVKKLGINLALGADWTPTGSKNLLDELKIARRYLDKNKIMGFSDKELVKMATVNAAKALRLDGILGKVAKGYQADLMLIDPAKIAGLDAYAKLVGSSQADIELVVVAGEAIYGAPEKINFLSKLWGDKSEPEILPKHRENCGFQKAIRNPNVTAFDLQVEKAGQGDFRTVAGLEAELSGKLDAYREAVKTKEPGKIVNVINAVDPLFVCEDPAYTAQFADFIEKKLDANAKNRKAFRIRYKLDDKWSPMSNSDDPNTDEM